MRHKSLSKKLGQLLDRKKKKERKRIKKLNQETKTKVKVKMIERLYA